MAAAPGTWMARHAHRRPRRGAAWKTTRQLVACGCVAQSPDEMNLYRGQRVAVRQFVLAPGHGWADYLACEESRDDAAALPAPRLLAATIVEELVVVLAEFSELAESLPADAADDAGGGARS